MKIEDLNIIYEDNHIIVVIKPQNIPTQKDDSGDQDMLSVVKEYVKEKYNKPGNVYVGLVHRLDRPTGGLLVFAKTSKAASRLSEQIQNGEFDKRYLTVVVGAPNDKTKKLENYLKKDERTNVVKIVPRSEDGAKKAELVYNVLDTYNEYIEIPIVMSPRTKLNYNEILTKNEDGSPVVEKPKWPKKSDEPVRVPKTTERKAINTLSLVEV
jgi:23S rRNA pseudouridine1911/1915/1917 synthase